MRSTRARRAAAVVGAVVLLVALAWAGWRLGHDLSSRFATPICPFVPGRPTCAAYGFTNGTAYYLAWWCGAAGAAALAGLALVGLGQAGRQPEPRTMNRFETVVVVLLVAGLAVLGFLVAESVAYELLSPSRSYICAGSGCGDAVLAEPEPNLVAWGVGGGAIAVVVGLALLRLGRAIWPVRDTAAG